MLLPSDLDKIGDKVEQWYYYLSLSLVDEMATRISATSEANMVVLNDFNILQQMGKTQKEIYGLIASFNNQSESEVAEIFKGAIKASNKRDNVIFSQNGVKDLKLSESIMQTIQADYVKTKNTLDNLTQTTALSAQEAFIRAMNQAHIQVVSGAKSYTEVMIDTIKKVSQDLDYIEYPSGRKDRVEVAVRRAMVTSVNQTASQVQLNRCMEYGCMLVETSAHIGARPEHEEWQGKVFSLVRGNPKYPYFYDETGYGTATGLCGVNCRHNFFPYYEGTAKAYTASELKKIKDAKVTYNGKTMSYYQATQYQRAMERKVRDYNRTLKGLTSINNANNADIDAEKVKKEILKVQSKKSDMLKMYADFTKQVGFKEDRNRFVGVGNNKIDLSRFVIKANKQVAKQAKKVITPIIPKPAIDSEVLHRLKMQQILYNPVKKLSKQLTEKAIINKIGGGDRTGGSCASVALAYIANKCGLDVLDYRGGASEKFFCSRINMKFLAQVTGVKCTILEDYNDFTCANNLLATLVEGKEYFMCVGQHGAIVKKVGNKYQYLELQTTNNNGFYDLTQTELRYRFGCKRSRTFQGWKTKNTGFLFEADSFKGVEELEEIFGYLNTKKGMELKGVGGYAK